MKAKWVLGLVALLLLASMASPNDSEAQVYVPPPCVDYYLNGNQRPTDQHVCKEVHYENGRWINVPVINGYVPEVREEGNKTIYDYRKGFRLSEVQYKGMPEERVKTTESRSFSEHDNSEWKSGLKPPKLPPPPKKVEKELPEWMKRPDKITEPEKPLIPKYEKK